MTGMKGFAPAWMRRSSTRRVRQALCVLPLLAACIAAQAQTRAWVDRDPIAVGETTTLNIETSEVGATSPDYSALETDFDVSGNTSSREVQVVNGQMRTRTLFAAALQPRHEGLLRIPSLRVGNASTQALSLTVTTARATRAGGPVFIETEVEDQTPYVQQAVGYTLKLFYNTPVVSGQLEQAPPDGAALQRIGSDKQYTDLVGGKRYTVVERRFLLTPERSGPLTIPGARFVGRGVGGFFDDMFGDGQRELAANGAPRFLTIRAAPANAPQPWLPLRGLTMRYLATPQDARAGQATTLEIEVRADGATGPQLPDVQLGPVDGAQVFADPPKIEENFDNGRPQVRLTRRFSIVPARSGSLPIRGPRVEWWDTRASIARIASVPNLNLQVANGAANPATVPLPGNASGSARVDGLDDANGARAPWYGDRVRPWALGTILFAALWLVTLLWGMQRSAGSALAPRPVGSIDAGAPPHRTDAMPKAGLRDLRHAFDTGDLGDVSDVLCAMAMPPARDLDALLSRLARADQRAAIVQLQRARWGGGDAAAARSALREAFATGPERKATPTSAKPVLPPLYPAA